MTQLYHKPELFHLSRQCNPPTPKSLKIMLLRIEIPSREPGGHSQTGCQRNQSSIMQIEILSVHSVDHRIKITIYLCQSVLRVIDIKKINQKVQTTKTKCKKRDFIKFCSQLHRYHWEIKLSNQYMIMHTWTAVKIALIQKWKGPFFPWKEVQKESNCLPLNSLMWIRSLCKWAFLMDTFESMNQNEIVQMLQNWG